MRTRRKFTDEFKREAVKVASQPGVTITAVARDLGVERRVLRRRVENAHKGRYDTPPGKPLKSDAQIELEQVEREGARAKTERDILKKALGYFAKDPT